MTRHEAIDEMLALFKAAWDSTGYGVKYENVAKEGTPPSDHEPWARVTIRHGSSEQASLAGEVGTRRFRRTGILAVQVFEIPGKGVSGGVDLPKIVNDAFEGVSTSGGVWFRNVQINEVGASGGWWQTNVTAAFEYDEIK